MIGCDRLAVSPLVASLGLAHIVRIGRPKLRRPDGEGRIMRSIRWLLAGGALALLTAAGPIDRIGFPRPRIFPESITATSAGDLYVSAADDGSIWHARPGDAAAAEWLSPAQTGMVAMLGVLADEKYRTLWACSRPGRTDPADVRDRASALLAFDLRTKAAKGRWQMPGGAKDVCNDMVVGADGSLYIAETAGGRIIRLRKGASALDIWFADPRLDGVDGIAFDTDGTLYLSSVRSSRVFRLPLDRAGQPGTLVELTPSRPLDHPDAMRFVAKGRFLFGENGEAGGISEAIVAPGDKLDVRMLPGSLPGTTSAIAYRGRAYGVVAKLRFRAPEMAGQDPGPFDIYSVPMP
jgi:sugar lactone lactonase YvrE